MPSITLSDELKERVARVADAARTAVHYGWIPFVLYLGWTSTAPQHRPNLLNLLSPLPSM